MTQAAGTGLYDLEAHTWNRELITTIGSDRVLFPVVGEQAVQFLWNGKHITAYPALGDQQAALFGADFLDEDEISFNLGTGAQVSRLTQTFLPDCLSVTTLFRGKLSFDVAALALRQSAERLFSLRASAGRLFCVGIR